MTNIKVGDRVKVVGSYATGQEGVVIGIRDTGDCRIEVEHGPQQELTYFLPSSLELITPAAPAIPDEIEINGAKYRRVIEEAAPEKPEPKAGQVWRMESGTLLLLHDQGRNVHLKSGVMDVFSHKDCARYCTFIAPTLADALERGLITAADLR